MLAFAFQNCLVKSKKSIYFHSRQSWKLKSKNTGNKSVFWALAISQKKTVNFKRNQFSIFQAFTGHDSVTKTAAILLYLDVRHLWAKNGVSRMFSSA